MTITQSVLPKEGAPALECEDAIGTNAEALRFAVADGATEAFGAKRWARYLARAWVSSSTHGADDDTYLIGLTALSRRFQSRALKPSARAWYLEAKAAQGSFAALLGVEIHLTPPVGAWWEALSVGDCCLVHLQERGNAKSFPFDDPTQFGSHPIEIGSDGLDWPSLKACVRRDAGVLRGGDSLLLMTDAVAQWYLRYCTGNATMTAAFNTALLGGRDAFQGFVARERDQKRLRDDDIAVLRVALAAEESAPRASES